MLLASDCKSESDSRETSFKSTAFFNVDFLYSSISVPFVYEIKPSRRISPLDISTYSPFLKDAITEFSISEIMLFRVQFASF